MGIGGKGHDSHMSRCVLDGVCHILHFSVHLDFKDREQWNLDIFLFTPLYKSSFCLFFMLFLYAYSLWQILSLQTSAEHFTRGASNQLVKWFLNTKPDNLFSEPSTKPHSIWQNNTKRNFFSLSLSDLEAKCLDFLQIVVYRA